MKKILIFTLILNMLIGALLCAFIVKDAQISAPEAGAGLVWILSMNALGAAVARTLKKKPAAEKKPAPSLTLLRGGAAADHDPRKPAA